MQIWNSRRKLFLNTIFLSFLSIILHFDFLRFECISSYVFSTDSYIDDVKKAIQAFDYLYDLQRGKAKILPVVEKPKKTIEYQPCWSSNEGLVKNHGWVENERWFLFSAYLDERFNSLYENFKSIQVLAMTFDEPPPNLTFYCHIFAQNNQNFLVQAHLRIIWQKAWDPRSSFYNFYLITCVLPYWMKTEQLDLSVSLSSFKCPRENLEAIKVSIPSKESPNLKPSVAICVKGLDFLEDMSKRLIEWVELNLLLGADRITLYTYYVPEKTRKILGYYEKLGKITEVNISLPGNSPNEPFIRHGYIWRNRQQKRRHELIPYNDCFYRYINSHDFVLIIDTDEVVVPLQHTSYSEMLKSIISESPTKNYTSISIRNVFKFTENDNQYQDFYMLSNRKRSKTLLEKESYAKSFISTKTVASVFNHFALHKLHPNIIRTVYLDEEVALKLHYREDCPIESRKQCKKLKESLIEDTSLDKFEKELKKRVRNVYKLLQL